VQCKQTMTSLVTLSFFHSRKCVTVFDSSTGLKIRNIQSDFLYPVKAAFFQDKKLVVLGNYFGCFSLLDATRRYSTLLDATRRYSTLLDATRRYSTLLDATRRYSMLLYKAEKEAVQPTLNYY
jgi:hypothetical protein